MTPAARVQSAIELLDAIIEAARANGPPADRLIADWAKANRYAGSKDRRAIRELVYRAIRACGPVPPSGRAAMLLLAQDDPTLRDRFDGSPHAPAPIGAGDPVAEGGAAPGWLVEALERSGVDAEGRLSLLERAPLDIRANRLKTTRDALELPEPGEPLAAPDALRVAHGTPVTQWRAYLDGLIEVQDHGSQLACLAVEARAGETVIDLCAGAGGKTLALAAAMEEGRLVACDTDRGRLAKLDPRARRAGAHGIEKRLLDPGREREALHDLERAADVVLVDAPCSGTGTWRRNPEARWRLTPDDIERHAALQDRLLDLGAEFVRPGGRLIYVTCSLLDAEGADRAAAFLARHADWRSDPPGLPLGLPRRGGWRLTPRADATDGFFIARFVSPC